MSTTTLIPQWLTGKAVTALSIAPASVAADGTVTLGSGASLKGRFSSISFTPAKTLVEKVAADQLVATQVVVGLGGTIEIEEIEQISSADGAQLNVAFQTYAQFDYVLVHCARAVYTGEGDTATVKVWEVFCAVESFKESIDRENGTGSLTLKVTSIQDSTGAEYAVVFNPA